MVKAKTSYLCPLGPGWFKESALAELQSELKWRWNTDLEQCEFHALFKRTKSTMRFYVVYGASKDRTVLVARRHWAQDVLETIPEEDDWPKLCQADLMMKRYTRPTRWCSPATGWALLRTGAAKLAGPDIVWQGHVLGFYEKFFDGRVYFQKAPTADWVQVFLPND